MLRGYWRYIFAVVGCLTLAAAPAPSVGDSNQQTKSSEAGDPQLERIASAIQELPKGVAPDPGCPDGAEDRNSDLCAQWKAADAAADSALWSWWMMLASFLGLGIGGGTLIAAWLAAKYAKDAARHTQRGANEAERAADAAEASIAETIRIGEAQTRAYLAISKVTARKVVDGLRFDVTIRNAGQSPALDVQLIAHIADEDGSLVELENSTPCVIASGLERIMPHLYFSRIEARNWTSIVVHINAIYDDVFGAKNTASETYAGCPVDWNGENGTELVDGRHIGSFLRNTSRGQAMSRTDDDKSQ